MKDFIRLILLALEFLLSQYTVAGEIDRFSERTLRIGIYTKSTPEHSRTELVTGIKFWGEEVGKAEHVPVHISFFDDLALLKESFEQGEINFAMASSWTFVEYFKLELLRDGFKVANEHYLVDDLLLVTRNDESFSDFKHLAGKSIGVINNELMSEVFLDMLTLKYFSQRYKRVFKTNFLREPKASRLIFDLFFKKVDAVVVFQQPYQLAMELNPQIEAKTQVIERLPGALWIVGYFHKNVDPDFREEVIAKITKVNTTVRGKQLLQTIGVDKFTRSAVDDLDMTKKFKENYQKLLRKTK